MTKINLEEIKGEAGKEWADVSNLTWNYRIVKEVIGEEYFYTIREVFYDDDKKVISWTVDEVSPGGSNADEMNRDWASYKLAFERPVVVVKDDKFIGEEELG